MTGRLEGNPTVYYGRLFDQLIHTAKLSTQVTESFLDIRKRCLGELTLMQQLAKQLNPVPDYLTYSGAVEGGEDGRYYCHSARNTFFTNALIEMHQEYNGGRFTADAKNQIVAADVNALIPSVTQFTQVIEAEKAYHLPKNHPGVTLYSLAHKVVNKIIQGQGSIEYVVFMLAEGVNEPIDDISVILHR